jgi:endonuclease/exonuclease/phosphatase family metal-dependent hydrolase
LTVRRNDGRVARWALVAILLASRSVGAAEQLRIATYNIFVGNTDLDRSVATILSHALDLVALQEVTPRQAELLDVKLAERFPYRFFPRSSHGGGVGFVSRVPLENARYLASERGYNGFAFAECTVGGESIQVANVHLDPIRAWTLAYALTVPWQLLHQGAIHRQELAQVSAALRPRMATVVLGDLNAFASVAAPAELTRWGLVDSFAAARAEAARMPTHRAAIAGIPIGRRLDYIFHSAELRTVDSVLIPGEPSDHDMVVSTLELSK